MEGWGAALETQQARLEERMKTMQEAVPLPRDQFGWPDDGIPA